MKASNTPFPSNYSILTMEEASGAMLGSMLDGYGAHLALLSFKDTATESSAPSSVDKGEDSGSTTTTHDDSDTAFVATMQIRKLPGEWASLNMPSYPPWHSEPQQSFEEHKEGRMVNESSLPCLTGRNTADAPTPRPYPVKDVLQTASHSESLAPSLDAGTREQQGCTLDFIVETFESMDASTSQGEGFQYQETAGLENNPTSLDSDAPQTYLDSIRGYLDKSLINDFETSQAQAAGSFDQPELSDHQTSFGDPELDLQAAFDTGGGVQMPLADMVLRTIASSSSTSLREAEIEDVIRQNFLSFKYDPLLGASINQVLQQYDCPARPKYDQTKNKMTFSLPQSLAAAESWLSKPQPQFDSTRPNKLLDLPDRVRFMIWRSVLEMPVPKGKTWCIAPTPTIKDLEKMKTNAAGSDGAREQGTPYTSQARRLVTYLEDGKWPLYSRPMNEILALTTVNRQIYAEAMPIFYKYTTFHFNCPIGLEVFLRGMPSRRQYLQRLDIHYDPPQYYLGKWRAAFRLMQETSLKYLRLEINEGSLMGLGEGCSRVEGLEGFSELGKVRGVETVQLAGS